jgi:anti-sigma factor ChrR (cupin superfamily)
MLLYKAIFQHMHEGIEKTHVKFQDSQSTDRDLNPGPSRRQSRDSSHSATTPSDFRLKWLLHMPLVNESWK